MKGVSLVAGLLIGFALGSSLRPRETRAPAAAETAAAPAEGCAHDAATFRCVRFDHNYDGDTITFQIPGVHPLIGKNISVRVFGIDAPEIKGHGSCEKEKAAEARELVRGLLAKAKRIELRNVQRDKYFRILADVNADGVSISERVLAAGLAVPYDGGTKAKVDWCRTHAR